MYSILHACNTKKPLAWVGEGVGVVVGVVLVVGVGVGVGHGISDLQKVQFW